MEFYNSFFRSACKKYGFSENDKTVFCNVAKTIDRDPDFSEKFNGIRRRYLFPKPSSLQDALKELKLLGEEKGIHEYTIHMVFLIVCSQQLLKWYRKKGYPDALFWETMQDLGYKAAECQDIKHIPGTYVAHWNDKFFLLDRFTRGRFQYERGVFPLDYVTKSGQKIAAGSKCLHVHIPSSGVPLTDEVRMDSYRKAYDFFRDELQDGILVLHCSSWLLDPKQKEFLPEHSNVLKFLNDFQVYRNEDYENFPDGWRIFGDAWGLPVEQLPEKTGLQRAYKKWLLAGNRGGRGWGFFLFDGDKIID